MFNTLHSIQPVTDINMILQYAIGIYSYKLTFSKSFLKQESANYRIGEYDVINGNLSRENGKAV